MRNNLVKILSILSLTSWQIQSVFAEATNDATKNTGEMSFVIQKFGFTILITTICIISITILLIIYRKVTNKRFQTLQYGERDLSLETPTNMEDAIKHFLEKTKSDTEN